MLPGKRRLIGWTLASAWLILFTTGGALQHGPPLGILQEQQYKQALEQKTKTFTIHSHSRSVKGQSSNRLKACIVTGDFWGILKVETGRGVRANLKGGGGTATANHLLAKLLMEKGDIDVIFLGVTKEIDTCTQAQKVMHCNSPPGLVCTLLLFGAERYK
jgi:hypothetical protein